MASLTSQQNHAALVKSLERAQPGSLVRTANVTGFDVRDGKALYTIVVIPVEGKAAELSYTVYKTHEEWEAIRSSVESATKMSSPFPKKNTFGKPSHRDFSVRKDQFQKWLHEALDKTYKMALIQRVVLKWLEVHVHCAIALAPGSMATYTGPQQGAVKATAATATVVASGAAEQEFAPVGAVVAGGAAEQEFAPVGTVINAAPAPTVVVGAAQPVAVSAAVVGAAQPVQATPTVVVVDKTGYAGTMSPTVNGVRRGPDNETEYY